MCIEEDPNDIFQRLAIKDVTPLQENQEYEFTLSSKGLTLRIVTLENFRETEDRIFGCNMVGLTLRHCLKIII